ncbi:MAG: carboxypeptidase-like regulatory domain-containing protein [Bacteroidales bacterium]|nr:carboxypeptidase-like regulatory domain-containing protein [Bacteroidales bacterium]
MKKIFILLLLAAFTFQGTSSLFAQTKATVYGNLGEENVNISIVNTPYGTSTDAKGCYELPLYDRTETVNLYYSCIGYQDTLVSLTPRQLQRDSINISFTMRKMSYDLQEVGVTAYEDFYRTKTNRNIADMAFLDGNIYMLENRPKASSMVVLDTDGVELARKDFDQLFEKLHIDAFNDLILVGQDSCLQVYLDEKQSIQPVSTFSRDDYRNKLLKIVCEYNGAYIVRTIVHDRGLYWLKFNHGKTQDFLYVMKDGSMEKPQYLCSFVDTLGYCACQSQWMKIQNEYHKAMAENYTLESIYDENGDGHPMREGESITSISIKKAERGSPGIDLINEGIWDGNLVRLAETPTLLGMIQWYCSMMAKKEFQIVPLKVNGLLQLVGLDNREIVEIGTDFKITNRQSLKITSGEMFFKNEFLVDKVTGKVYGLFVDNGAYHVGLYDPESGTIGIGQKASNKIYPRVFKVHDGYAYSVYFDSGSNRGVINRVKIE